MLNLNDPTTQHIFTAAGGMDAILNVAKQMTVANGKERARLNERAGRAFEQLRQLARDHFAKDKVLPATIDALEQALARLAALAPLSEDGPSADYKCPACGADLDRRGADGMPNQDQPTTIYCSPCLKIIMPALSDLGSGQRGFAIDFI